MLERWKIFWRLWIVTSNVSSKNKERAGCLTAKSKQPHICALYHPLCIGQRAYIMCMHKCVYSRAGTAAKLWWAANSLRVVCELNANLLSRTMDHRTSERCKMRVVLISKQKPHRLDWNVDGQRDRSAQYAAYIIHRETK